MSLSDSIFQRLHQAALVLRMLTWSARRWSLVSWRRFWFSRQPRCIQIQDWRFEVRGGRWTRKVADFAMLYEVIRMNVYDIPGRPEPKTVVDIGSHIGGFAVRAASVADTVLAVEADPATFAQLQTNVALNELKNVVLVNRAIAGRRGRLSFYVNDSNPAENSLWKKNAIRTEVDAETLGDLLARYGIVECDLLKLDCEGAEYEILFAAKDVLHRVRAIVMEYHEPKHFCLPAEYTPQRLADYLRDQGFSVALSRQNRFQGILMAVRQPSRR